MTDSRSSGNIPLMKTYVINLSDADNRNHMVFTADGFMAVGKSIPENYPGQEQAIKAYFAIGRDDFLRAGLKGQNKLNIWLTEWDEKGDATVIRQRDIIFDTDTN